MGDVRNGWIASVVSHHADAIRNADPGSQLEMRPNVRAWNRWFADDSLVLHVVKTYEAGISRKQLHSLALNSDLSSRDGRRNVFVTTLVWGVGSTNRYYGRHRRLLTDAGLDEALESSYRHLLEGETEDAFRAMDRLPGITFRFHTKWLWIAGSALGLQPVPLIFDNRVMASLRGLDWPEMTQRQSASRRWFRYIEDAAIVAQDLDVTAEHVELWLFNQG